MSNKISRLGIFGGSFDPLHLGHINSMISVAQSMDLPEIKVVPAYQSPFRQLTQGPSPEQRLEMLRVGLEGYTDLLCIDDQEIRRGGVSYTHDTMKAFKQNYPETELFLVVGVDQFEEFDRWKNFSDILSLANLVVTSRPGAKLPKALGDFPVGLLELVQDFDGSQALLDSEKSIYFLQLEDLEVSATEVRKCLRSGLSAKSLIPSAVEDYIRENHLYEAMDKKIGNFEDFTRYCGGIIKAKNGIRPLAFDLRELNQPAEFSLVTSGTSKRQSSALAENLVREVKSKYGVYPQNIEGLKEGRWIVLDYGSLIVHVFYDYVRHEYRLEDLWKQAVELSL